jgi:CheY-like chemotaxis protein
MSLIMVADDDGGVLELTGTILRKAGHTVVTCISGRETLKKLGIFPEDPAAEVPDLLLLDIMMPGSDGYTVGTVIRSHKHTGRMPLVLLTALREMTPLFSATLKIDGFITKPFDPDVLISGVAKALEKSKAKS